MTLSPRYCVNGTSLGRSRAGYGGKFSCDTERDSSWQWHVAVYGLAENSQLCWHALTKANSIRLSDLF